MELTNLYKGIKFNQKSIMWIALLFIVIITIPLLMQKIYIHEGMSGGDGDGDEDGDENEDGSANPEAKHLMLKVKLIH